MKPLDLANQYMKIFFESGSVEPLSNILSDDFTFTGPFYQFHSARAYIDALKSDPPESMSYRIIESYENENSACLIYEFIKPGISTLMSQIFTISNGKISDIKLIFDASVFK